MALSKAVNSNNARCINQVYTQHKHHRIAYSIEVNDKKTIIQLFTQVPWVRNHNVHPPQTSYILHITKKSRKKNNDATVSTFCGT